jgi:hypothetical protein
MTERPRLRPLDFQPVFHQGQRMWLLRDPLELTDRQLMVPAALAQMVLLIDGTRTPGEIERALSVALGQPLPAGYIDDTLAMLDEACLLQNARAAAAERRLLAEYRAQPYRPAALAGLSYPADPVDLAAAFSGFGWGSAPPVNGTPLRGIVSPHIDYGRGGKVYAEVWSAAAPAVLEAEVVIMLGTDHNGGPGTVTLTRQPYATPYGVLPIDTDLVDRLAGAIGPEAAYAEELHHRREHSVELSAVWLHHVFHEARRAPCPMVPVLVGSFHHFVTNGSHPAHDPRLNRFLEALGQATNGRRTLVVASVDLAHVGPAFGDAFTMDRPRREALRAWDAALMDTVLAGDADAFFRHVASVQDRNRICGFSALYLMLRHLGQASGGRIDYQHCPADSQDTSLVSICGLLLE